jgi:hypothetical protein
MTMKKVRKFSNRGGAREGSGRKPGRTKEKISVSVDSGVLVKALAKWGGKTSALVEELMIGYAGK